MYSRNYAERASSIENSLDRLPKLLSEIRDRIPVPEDMPPRVVLAMRRKQEAAHARMCEALTSAIYGDAVFIKLPSFGRRGGQSSAVTAFVVAYLIAFPGRIVVVRTPLQNDRRLMLENVVAYAMKVHGVDANTGNRCAAILTNDELSFVHCVYGESAIFDYGSKVNICIDDASLNEELALFDHSHTGGISASFTSRTKHPASELADAFHASL